MGRIETAVQEIRSAVGCDVPIDVEALATRLGLTIVRQPLEESVSGMLVVKGEGGVIGVNEAHHANRRRFTIAHEIGHFMLHRGETSVFVDAAPIFYRDESSADGSKSREKEANIFAAELLMPRDALVERLRQREHFDPSDDIALRQVAAQFGVSTQALLIRLTNLGMIDG